MLSKYFVNTIPCLLLMTIISCNDEQVHNRTTPSTIFFGSTNSSSGEESGIHEISIHLDHPQSNETVIHIALEGNATEANHTRYGMADYELLTPSPIIIKKGETSAPVRFRIKEDEIFEKEEEYLTIKINEVLEGNAVLDQTQDQLTFTHFIRENDFQMTKSEADFNLK